MQQLILWQEWAQTSLSSRVQAMITNASFEYEAHVGLGAPCGRKVVVERAAWVGIRATGRDQVVIGAHSIVGAGAVVLANVPARVVAYGVPATVRKAALSDGQG